MDFLKRYVVALLAMLAFVAYFGNQVWQQRSGEASSTEVLLVGLAGSAIMAALAVTISNYRLVRIDDSHTQAQQHVRTESGQSRSEKRKRDRGSRQPRHAKPAEDVRPRIPRLEDNDRDDNAPPVPLSELLHDENDTQNSR